MQAKISRRKLAAYVVDSFERGTSLSEVMNQLAAYLVETGRVREFDLVVRMIETILAERGTVIVRVTSAHPLTEALRRDVEAQVPAKKVLYEEIIDPTVIGGIRIETPGQLLDATMKRKLLALRQAKV